MIFAELVFLKIAIWFMEKYTIKLTTKKNILFLAFTYRFSVAVAVWYSGFVNLVFCGTLYMFWRGNQMNKNLLIIGAGPYGEVASEIAVDMGCFEKIDFLDDERKVTPNGIDVVGTTQVCSELATQYSNIIVAIEEPEVRLSWLHKIKEEMPYCIISLVSPKAYVSPSAQIMCGCIIEPMAVVHTGCVIGTGCIISAGAVVKHATKCCDAVHVDCNATVEEYCVVPAGSKICIGEVYNRKGTIKGEDLFFEPQKAAEYLTDISKRTPKDIDGLEYTFESGM